MQIGNPMAQSPAVGQPVSTSANASEGGVFKNIRKVFFSYDPVEGTRTKYIPCLTFMAGAASAGAVSFDALVQNWTPARVVPGAALTDRLIAVVENTVQRNPFACGAAAGAATAFVGLSMLASSLKPLAKECIEAVREELRHQLQRDFQEITVRKELISQHQKNLSELEVHLSAEKARYNQLSQEVYLQRWTCYRREAGYMAGQLKGYVDGVLSSNPGNRGNVQRGRHQGDVYKAGVELSRFVSKENQDYSFLSRLQLLNALKPVLTESEYKKVKNILRDFPVKPYPIIHQGPVTREYAKIQEQCASEQREVGVLESKIKKVLGQYPNLRPDAAGNIPQPPAKEFEPYMPK